MKVTVLLDNGKTTNLVVKWHPEWKSNNSFYNVIRPAGLYTTISKIKTDNLEFSKTEITHHNIVSAEAPFEIFIDTEDEMPWKHYGTTMREVPYGEEIDWKHM